MKLGIITSTYPRHASDAGAVPWMREAVSRLVSRKIKVEIFAPSYKGLKDHFLDGVPVRRFRYFPSPWERLTHDEGATNKVNNPLFKLLAIPYVAFGTRAAVNWAKETKPDIIHVHWPFPHGRFGEAIRSVLKVPIVAMCHGAELSIADRKPWAKKLLTRYLTSADALVANSEDTARRMKELVHREVAVIPYGTTVELGEATRGNNTPPVVLFTGRLIQRKGVKYLVEAIPHVLQKRPVKVIITGNGDHRAEIEALVKKLNLQDVVEMPGIVSKERLQELYATSDVYVLPAVYDDNGDTEGLGVTSIEAALYSMPIVATTIGGITDVVQDNVTGLHSNEKDPKSIAAAILRILDDPALAQRLGEAACKHVRECFNWERITDRQIEVYERVLSK